MITAGGLAPSGGDTGGFIQTFDTRKVGTNKTLTATGTVNDGNSGNNYAVTFATDMTGVIDPRAITVTAATDTKTYDGSTSSSVTPTITSGTLAPGGGDTAAFSEAFDTRNAGTNKTLVPTGTVNDGNSGNNYAITFATDTSGVINQRAITVTAATDSKTYDGSTSSSATPTITSGSLASSGGDTAAFIETFDNRNVGTNKTLTPSGMVNDGNSGNNYAVAFAADTNGVINPRALTITADDKGKAVSDPLPPFTATYGGFAFGDDPASLSGTLVFATPATAISPVGVYGITPSGKSSTNYNISFMNGVLTVASPPLFPSGVQDALASVYDDLPDIPNIVIPGDPGGNNLITLEGPGVALPPGVGP